MDFDLLIVIVSIALVAVFAAIGVLKGVFIGLRIRQGLDAAKNLERQDHHQEAYNAYEAILRQTPPGYKDVRAKVMLNLSLTALHTGRQELSLEWATRIIALRPKPFYEIMAHCRAGGSLMILNRLDEAHPHFLAQRDLALRTGHPDKVAQATGQLGILEMKRGNLLQAEQIMLESLRGAADIALWSRYCLLSEIYRRMGRFDEAKDALLQARKAWEEKGISPKLPPAAQEYHRKRQGAVLAFYLARLEAARKKPESAWAALQEAREGLKDDERMNIWYESSSAWILTLLGKTEDARQKMDQVERAVSVLEKGTGGRVWPAMTVETDQDQQTVFIAYSNLSQATFVLGQYQRSREFLERCLALPLSPVDRNSCFYYLGKSLEKLNDLGAAAENYRRCVEMNIPSYHAKLAAERLQGMGVASATA